MTGRIHSIQTLGAVDGPGVRCVVFFQGCPLRCAFCHNPDTWDKDRGTLKTTKDVFDKIIRVVPYLGKNGGITLSGGEPLLQPEFASVLLKLCKDNKIHTALDTSGCIFNDSIKNLMGFADLILLDIKFNNDSLYQKYTGGSLNTVLKLLEYLNDNNKTVWLRQVILPGINDTENDISELCKLIKPYQCIKKLELLPFRKLCLEKYHMLGVPFAFEGIREADSSKVAVLQKFADRLLFDK